MTEEQRQERLNYHMYTTCETPAEHAERIVKLEELVQHMSVCIRYHEWGGNVCCEECPLDNDAGECDFEHRMEQLEVPHV